jgi:selT/selW/selH-like putative selenoprotein
LAARLKETLGLEVELIEGDRGVFDVFADDRLLFSKHSEGRFPDEQEIVDALRATVTPDAGSEANGNLQ